MSKTLVAVAAIFGVSAIFSVACSTKYDSAADPPPTDSSGVSPFIDAAGASPGDDGGIPLFNFDDSGSTTTPINDAGPDVTPAENDPGATQGALIFGTDAAGRLVSFREKAAGTVGVKLVTGLASGDVLRNVTFRPATGVLYGLGSASHLYTIDPKTGVATVVGDGMGFTPSLAAQANGFDFNPVADKIRIQTDVDQDLRIDPATAKVAAMDATLAFAPADPNFGQSPNLVGTAYTNSVTPAPTTTMLYAVDSTRNLLVKLPNPDDGMIATVGDLGVDIDQASGFDVAKTGTAYAAFLVGTELGLYTIDLTSAHATKMGVIGYPVALTSIAVQP